jgi:hypothetical protein
MGRSTGGWGMVLVLALGMLAALAPGEASAGLVLRADFYEISSRDVWEYPPHLATYPGLQITFAIPSDTLDGSWWEPELVLSFVGAQRSWGGHVRDFRVTLDGGRIVELYIIAHDEEPGYPVDYAHIRATTEPFPDYGDYRAGYYHYHNRLVPGATWDPSSYDYWGFWKISIVSVPEPPTLAMAGTATLVGIGTAWRHRRRKAA